MPTRRVIRVLKGAALLLVLAVSVGFALLRLTRTSAPPRDGSASSPSTSYPEAVPPPTPHPPLSPDPSKRSSNTGSAAPKPPPVQHAKPPSSAANAAEANYSVVRVFYATDRVQSDDLSNTDKIYSGRRATSDALSMGTLDVSVPREHRLGKIERPSIFRLDFREDPEKHMVLLKVEPKPEAQFFSELANRVSASAGKEAFVFVHGYAVTFADAARRTAQLAYDLGFDGAPILYSWPSLGRIPDYPADEATIEWTTPHLKRFLENIAANSQATTVHLIAHSMGNRALTASLSAIAREHGVPPMFKQVFLAAPDIDIGVFNQLAETFPIAADHVTLYCSSKDEALVASKKFHKYPRAGDAGTMIAIAPKIDTIDATGVDTGLLGHSYYGDNRSILTDMFYTIRNYEAPAKRFGMRPNRPENPTYWLFQP